MPLLQTILVQIGVKYTQTMSFDTTSCTNYSKTYMLFGTPIIIYNIYLMMQHYQAAIDREALMLMGLYCRRFNV